jgi:hypothetical protein
MRRAYEAGASIEVAYGRETSNGFAGATMRLGARAGDVPD